MNDDDKLKLINKRIIYPINDQFLQNQLKNAIKK